MYGVTAVPLLFLLCGVMEDTEASALNSIPRKTVTFQNGINKVFTKPGIFNYSTLLISEEANFLFVGAREAIFALDLNDISKAMSYAYWTVPENVRLDCTHKGKDKDSECQNYIRTLHRINATTLYVCGTSAFQPTCDYMAIVDGQIQLLGRTEEGKGKCPFDPAQRYASVIVDGELYSATSNNFLGSEPIILRSLGNGLRTEYTASWLNEPSFVHVDVIRESENNPDGDDDKIYLFFSEAAVEFDFYDKLLVPRIARVCKGDRGGMRTLQRKWTSFLKSRLSCSEPSISFQFNVIQDVFALKTTDWRDTIFYGVFIPQWGSLDFSAVCAFSLSDIDEVFSYGNFQGPVTVEQTLYVKWVMYSGKLPNPRPGACINNVARSNGYLSSLDLPDKTLQFVKDHPLMDDAVNPIDKQPKLLKQGSKYTRIAVDRVVALDNNPYDVMFLGTDDGYLHKAINYQGEMFIIEEVQLFSSPEPVQNLQLSSSKGYLYAGSPSQVVQIPVSVCSRYKNCLDCVLARDPYCVWARTQQQCVAVAQGTANPQGYIQNIKNGDASECPTAGNSNLENCTFITGSTIQLKCTPMSSLANTKWLFNGSLLQVTDSKHLVYDEGIVIFNVSMGDAGYYDCHSVERANGKEFQFILASYALHPQQVKTVKRYNKTQLPRILTTVQSNKEGLTTNLQPTSISLSMSPASKTLNSAAPPVHPPQAQADPEIELTLIILVAVFAALFMSLLVWNLCKGHIPCICRAKGSAFESPQTDCTKNPELSAQGSKTTTVSQDSRSSVTDALLIVKPSAERGKRRGSNNNNNADSQENRNSNSASMAMLSLMTDLKYIDDEETEA